MTQNVGKLYKSVIDDVVNSMREAFTDDGVDEQVLMELKLQWERRLTDSKAIESKDGDQGQGTSSGSASKARGRQTQNHHLQQQSMLPTYPSAVGAASSSAAVVRGAVGGVVHQLDGPHDSSDEDDDDDDEKKSDDDEEDAGDPDEDRDHESPVEDEEPLNSEDDVSDEEPNELFETDNVVVCQYDKITRSRNKWKFHLKDGIMNLSGRDYVFQKAVGDAEW